MALLSRDRLPDAEASTTSVELGYVRNGITFKDMDPKQRHARGGPFAYGLAQHWTMAWEGGSCIEAGFVKPDDAGFRPNL